MQKGNSPKTIIFLLVFLFGLIAFMYQPGGSPHQGSVSTKPDPTCIKIAVLPCTFFTDKFATAFPSSFGSTHTNTSNSGQEHTTSLPASYSLGAPQAPAGEHSVVGSPPSFVNADFINTILAQAGSRDAGLGQYWIDFGQKYNLNPLYGLAFYHHESGYGTTGMAVATLSTSNMRCTAAYTCTNGYAQMPNRVEGIRLWFSLIRETYINAWGLSTVEQIVPVYAPRADHNNPVAYIDAVNHDVAAWTNGSTSANP